MDLSDHSPEYIVEAVLTSIPISPATDSVATYTPPLSGLCNRPRLFLHDPSTLKSHRRREARQNLMIRRPNHRIASPLRSSSYTLPYDLHDAHIIARQPPLRGSHPRCREQRELALSAPVSLGEVAGEERVVCAPIDALVSCGLPV